MWQGYAMSSEILSLNSQTMKHFKDMRESAMRRHRINTIMCADYTILVADNFKKTIFSGWWYCTQ